MAGEEIAALARFSDWAARVFDDVSPLTRLAGGAEFLATAVFIPGIFDKVGIPVVEDLARESAFAPRDGAPFGRFFGNAKARTDFPVVCSFDAAATPAILAALFCTLFAASSARFLLR